jgi:CheY-like chemotaxis protein
MEPSKKKTILIVEDEKDILFPLRDFLESENYQVLTAENGVEAMQVLKASDMPDLILLDMKMPIMNGWEFAIEFLAKHDHQSPIVVITAAADAEQRAKDISAVGWVEKPFDLDVLLETIKKYEKK